MIDAGAFLGDYAEMQAHFTAQARLAGVIVINKTDLVSLAERRAVEATLSRLNPAARIITARYGSVPAEIFTVAAVSNSSSAHDHDHDHDHHHNETHDHDGCIDVTCTHPDHHHDHGHDHSHDHSHDHAHEDALGFASWSGTLDTICDIDALRHVLDAAAEGHFGSIARLKGLARSGRGWVQFDVAGHRASVAAFAAAAGEQARVIVIGRNLDEAGLSMAFAGCALRLAAE